MISAAMNSELILSLGRFSAHPPKITVIITMARTADDCGLVLAAIHGADPRDAASVDRPYVWPSSRDVSTIRVGYVSKGGEEEQSDEFRILRELGVKQAPRRLLARVRGLELREMQPAEECCGFGGTFSVKFAELSGAMAQTKIDAIQRTGAGTVVSLDPSCLMQIQGALSRAGSTVRTMHLAEVLASR